MVFYILKPSCTNLHVSGLEPLKEYEATHVVLIIKDNLSGVMFAFVYLFGFKVKSHVV
jgi:hypothetical protein